MTIASATNKSGPYNGNGVTVAFSGTFKISDQDHVQVILADADGVETVQTITTEYTVSGIGGSGFTVTMLAAPPSGSTVTLIRDVPFTQELDLQNQGAYYAESVEEALDAGVARDQQLQEQVSRAVLAPASATASDLAGLGAVVVRLGQSVDSLDAIAAITSEIVVVAGIVDEIIGAPAQATAAILAAEAAEEFADEAAVSAGNLAAAVATLAGLGFLQDWGLVTEPPGVFYDYGSIV